MKRIGQLAKVVPMSNESGKWTGIPGADLSLFWV